MRTVENENNRQSWLVQSLPTQSNWSFGILWAHNKSHTSQFHRQRWKNNNNNISAYREGRNIDAVPIAVTSKMIPTMKSVIWTHKRCVCVLWCRARARRSGGDEESFVSIVTWWTGRLWWTMLTEDHQNNNIQVYIRIGARELNRLMRND